MAKEDLRLRAIELRKSGLSYSEILKQISVAKSTLSLWLRSVGLARKQKQRLTEKKRLSALRGGEQRRLQRLALMDKIYEEAAADLGELSERELWLMGIMLYWAEGSKEKDYAPGSNVELTNTDPRMIRLFLMWLEIVAGVKREDITLQLYIHETKKEDVPNVIAFWSRCTGCPKEMFSQIYFKKHNIHTNRKNTGDLYFEVLKVKVKASSWLNRKISGWTQEICRQWGVV